MEPIVESFGASTPPNQDHTSESESIISNSQASPPSQRRQRSASQHHHDDLLAASKLSFEKIEHVDTNEVEPSEGRYFNYIRPTSTADIDDSLAAADMTDVPSKRTGKDLSIDPFLSSGGPRPISSGSPLATTSTSNNTIQPTSALSPETMPVVATLANHPRQNPNPDIQDIITGIVKLLNGNVNIHTNSQLSSRKPYPSRINNRGPPRISEAQPLPNDFDQVPPPLSGHRPQPPYPFDRPDGPAQNRPFINGVPLPEQVVPPSMQQNYRPGFISQNRPPWQRPRPRPPITGNRRPIPPYKPAPTMPEYRPEDDPTLTTLELDSNPDTVDPTDSNLDLNSYEVEEERPDHIESSSVEVLASTKIPSKKEEFVKKNKPKKPIVAPTSVTEETTTIMESTVEVVTTEFVYLDPTSTTTTTETQFSTLVHSSIVEIAPSDSSASKKATATPSLETSTTTSATLSTPSATSIPVPTSSISTELASTPPVADPNRPYHPRPGIVLDDPEFKPGSGRHPPQQRLPQNQIQPSRPVTPPGYGEIFDVTLSAIQGPSGSGSKQTIKIRPHEQGIPNGDIIVSPIGDDGFVSIDGKRTYLNLFGESTDTEAVATSPSTVVKPQQIVPTAVVQESSLIRASQQVVSRFKHYTLFSILLLTIFVYSYLPVLLERATPLLKQSSLLIHPSQHQPIQLVMQDHPKPATDPSSIVHVQRSHQSESTLALWATTPLAIKPRMRNAKPRPKYPVVIVVQVAHVESIILFI